MSSSIYQVFRANNEVQIYSVANNAECDNVRRIMQFAQDSFPGSEVIGGSLIQWSTPSNTVFYGRCVDEPENCLVFGVHSFQTGRFTVVAADWGRARQWVEIQGGTLETLITMEGLFKGVLNCKAE